MGHSLMLSLTLHQSEGGIALYLIRRDNLVGGNVGSEEYTALTGEKYQLSKYSNKNKWPRWDLSVG